MLLAQVNLSIFDMHVFEGGSDRGEEYSTVSVKAFSKMCFVFSNTKKQDGTKVAMLDDLLTPSSARAPDSESDIRK